MKNINGDMVFSIQHSDVKAVSSLEYEKFGMGYNKLNKPQDYEVFPDNNALFVKITKKLESGKNHHMKIKVLKPDGSQADLLTFFKPKPTGSIKIFFK